MTLKDDDRTIMIKHYMDKARESLKDSEIKENSPATRVSRAYYSAFYCATALLLTKNIERNSHKGILSEFGKEFVKSGEFSKNFGAYLRDLEGSRYSADYSVSEPTTTEEAEASCQKSRLFYEATVEELKKQFYEVR